MNRGGPQNSSILCSTILRCASRLVPRTNRSDWLAEWHAELWYVARCPQGRDNVKFFCLGAFRDAIWLRLNQPLHWLRPSMERPVCCLLVLLLLASGNIWLVRALVGFPKVFVSLRIYFEPISAICIALTYLRITTGCSKLAPKWVSSGFDPFPS
jgi:hypothetical protein